MIYKPKMKKKTQKQMVFEKFCLKFNNILGICGIRIQTIENIEIDNNEHHIIGFCFWYIIHIC